MPRFVAFLRALNVGGHVVKMDVLKRHFETMGFSDVETFIASGNVVFSSKAVKGLDGEIEAALGKALGYEVRAFVRTLAEVADAAAHAPFVEKDVAACPTYLVGFLSKELDADAESRLTALATAEDRFHVRGRDFWWLSGRRQSDPAISGRALEKALGQPTTLRNVNTIRRVAERFGASKKRG
ncbi:MAG TPA: DUF1697 domain-containing protein [Thermoanaerobaculia bacterium]